MSPALQANSLPAEPLGKLYMCVYIYTHIYIDTHTHIYMHVCIYICMEKAMAPHSSTLAWKIPWMEEPGGLQSMGSLSRTWLSNFTFTFCFHALEKEMATHSSVLAWRIPGTGEPDGLPSMGSHRVRHDWSYLAYMCLPLGLMSYFPFSLFRCYVVANYCDFNMHALTINDGEGIFKNFMLLLNIVYLTL